MNADALEVIFHRRSIRRYQQTPVPREYLEKILQAGMAAPSACNSRPWEFIVLDEPAALSALAKGLRFGKYDPPAAIVVCANLSIASNSAAKHFWQQDCSAAIENMLIAATALQLGSVWIGVYPIPGILSHVRETLGIPQTVTPLGIVYVGYPAEQKPARTQYHDRRVYWQRYGNRQAPGGDTETENS